MKNETRSKISESLKEYHSNKVVGFTLCDRCGKEKPNTKTLCNSCSVTKTRKKRHAELKAHFGGKCVRCGYDKCFGALEFHHLDPTQKEFTIAKRGQKSLARLILEAEKCVLLCANCHREIHADNYPY